MIYCIVSGGVRFGMALIIVNGDGDGEVGGNELPCEIGCVQNINKPLK